MMTSQSGIGWARSPRVLAGRLRRAQTFLRTLGIEIVFSREGRAEPGSLRCARPSGIPSAPSAPSAPMGQDNLKPGPADPPLSDSCRSSPSETHKSSITGADDADGADANAAVRFG